MSLAATLLVLRAHTGIHAGVGQEVGTVDLPIQRERVTQFPVVRGPSIKGALRQAVEDAGVDRSTVVRWIFGPETDKAHEHGGALSVADARLLLFPMRSLAGTFAWMTCPFALQRLRRDLVDANLHSLCPLGEVPTVGSSRTLVCDNTRVAFSPPSTGPRQTRLVVIEDYGFEVEEGGERQMNPLAAQLTRLRLDEAELKSRLALVGDDHYRNFVSFCTEVVTRVHLDDQTKTVKKGQLWTEELLPAESVLTALLVCADDRDEGSSRGRDRKTGKQLLEELKKAVGNRLQLGGKETVGYGICHAEWVGPIELKPAPRG